MWLKDNNMRCLLLFCFAILLNACSDCDNYTTVCTMDVPASCRDGVQWMHLEEDVNGPLSDEIYDFVNLGTLHAVGLKISSLPDSIGEIAGLKALSLYENQISTLPNSICGLERLEVLDISGNPLERLPECFGDLRNLVQLNLGQLPLKGLPDSFVELQSLDWLSLSQSEIASLPAGFGKLDQLRILRMFQMDNFEFSRGLVEIAGLIRLEELDISSNHIEGFPPSFINLTGLRKLDAYHINGLKSFPGILSRMTGLRTLHISSVDCPIDSGMFDMHFLTELSIGGTSLTDSLKTKLIDSLPNTRITFIMGPGGPIESN